MSARERRLLLFAFITVLLCAMITAVFGAWPCLAAAQPQELPAQIVTLGGRAELSRKSGPWAAAALRDELSAGDGGAHHRGAASPCAPAAGSRSGSALAHRSSSPPTMHP